MTGRPSDWGVQIEHVRGLYAQSQRRDLDPIAVNFSLASALTALAPLDSDARSDALSDAAREAGISASNLKIILGTAAAYPTYPDLGVPADVPVAWKALQLLARADDRMDQLAKMVADPDYPAGWRTGGRRVKGNQITGDRVRVLLGLKRDRKAPGGSDERARDLVSDLADEHFRLALRNLRGNSKAVQAARAMADAYDKALSKEQRRIARESDQAEKRIRSQAGKPPPPSHHTYWEDLRKRFDGALLFLATCIREADAIPGPVGERGYRTPFFQRGVRAIELGEKLARALADADPELLDGEVADDIPVAIMGMLPETTGPGNNITVTTRVIRGEGDDDDNGETP